MKSFKEVAEQFSESLLSLKYCSKSVIKTLTKIANDELKNAEAVVSVIEERLKRVKPDVMLALMYLIDSICKNIRGPYNKLFEKELISNFCFVFQACDKKTFRSRLHELRKAWGDKYHVFTDQKLKQLDLAIKKIDPAWTSATQQTKIDVKFHIVEKVHRSAEYDLKIKLRYKKSTEQDRLDAKKNKQKKKMEQNLKEKGRNYGNKGIKRPGSSQGQKGLPEKKKRLNSNSPDSGIELNDFPSLFWTKENSQALKRSLQMAAGIKNGNNLFFERLNYDFPDLDRLGLCNDDSLNSLLPGGCGPDSVSGERSHRSPEANTDGRGEHHYSPSCEDRPDQRRPQDIRGPRPSPLPSPRPSLSDIFRYFQLPPLLSPIKDPLLLESPESRPRKTRKDPGHEDSEKHPSLQVQFPLKKLKMTSYLRSTYLKNSVDVFV